MPISFPPPRPEIQAIGERRNEEENFPPPKAEEPKCPGCGLLWSEIQRLWNAKDPTLPILMKLQSPNDE